MNRRKMLASLTVTGLLIHAPLVRASLGRAEKDHDSSKCVDLRALFDHVSLDGKGFELASVSGSPTTIFVFFDPQCPDCIEFWKISDRFKTRVRFVWLPVAVLNSRSEPQGALILSSPNPAEMMSRQVKLFNTASRGLETDGLTIASSAREDVWYNSRMFRRAGGRSVPFLIAQDRNGRIKGTADVDSMESLEKFLSLNH